MVPEIRKAECCESGVKKLANIIQSKEFTNIIFICTKDPSHSFEKYQEICNKYKAFTTWLLGQLFFFLGSEKFLKVHDIVIDTQINILKHLSKTKLHIYNEFYKEYSKVLGMLVDFYNNPQGILILEAFVPEKFEDLNDNLDLTQVFIEVSSESKCVCVLEKMMKIIELFLLENFTFYSFDKNTVRNMDCLMNLFGSKNMSMKLSIVDIFLNILNSSTFSFNDLTTKINSKLKLFSILYEQLVYKSYNDQIWTNTEDMEKFETGLIMFLNITEKKKCPFLCLDNIYQFIYKKSLDNKRCVPSQDVQVTSLKKSQKQHHNRQSHIHHSAQFGSGGLIYSFENDIYKDILQKEHSSDITKSFLTKYISHIEICGYNRHLPIIYNFFTNLCLLTYRQNLAVIFAILALPLLKRIYLKDENSFSEFLHYIYAGDTRILMKSLYKRLSIEDMDCATSFKGIVPFFEVISSGLVEVKTAQIQEIEKAFMEICKGAFVVGEQEWICQVIAAQGACQ
ncbi:unnamed protein product [Callosobruchus maculatus]|uniref:Uncharacterized protein n=1 Tax=Callosobruchus maculatus TaxID=64391 RepID=A0A653DD49_CALMS|nr:unnamed protein product [Callosobruchus maculatus]